MSKNKKSKKVEELSVLPAPKGDWVELENSDIELSRERKVQGRLFEKHILNKGVLLHPVTGQPINIDDEFISQLKKNFDDGVCDIVQAPLADERNAHSEAPDRNTGEIVDIRERDGKVYAILDSRKYADDLGKTLLGASAMLSTNYKDTRTGKRVGPTLLHVAVTNRPYVTGLEDYKEIVAASNAAENTQVVVFNTDVPEVSETVEEAADNLNDETLQASMPTEENTTMTRDELIAALLEEHGIDVASLQAKADEADQATELSNTLAEQLAETLQLSENGVDTDTLVGAIAELAQDKVALSARVEGLEKAQAKHVVHGLVEAGFILPAMEETYTELRLSNPEQFEKLIPNEPLVKLNNMQGVEGDIRNEVELDIDAEVARYTGLIGK